MTVLPTCPHESLCCAAQNFQISYPEQLEEKCEHILAFFDHYPQLQVNVTNCQPASSVFEYRIRAKLAVGSKGEIGLFAPGTHEVIDLPDCLLLSPGVRQLAQAMREAVKNKQILPFRPEDESGLLRYLDIRESFSEKKLHLTLVLFAEEPPKELTLLAKSLMSRFSNLIGVSANLHPSVRIPQALGPNTVSLQGHQELWETLENTHYRYSPGTYSQTHAKQASYLLQRVKSLLSPQKNDSLLDVYAGGGFFSLAFAPLLQRTILIDSFDRAINDAKAAIQKNNVSIEVFAESAETILPTLSFPTLQRNEKNPGRLLTILHPPKRGLSLPVLQQVRNLSPQKIIYISSNPNTLARDLDWFAKRGYKAKIPLEPIDMIPYSHEVETLALLEPSSPTQIRILYQDEFCLAVDKFFDIPVHETGVHRENLKTRLEEQLGQLLYPVHRIDSDTSGITLFAKSAKSARAIGQLFEKGEVKRKYLVLVQGKTRAKGVINRFLKEEGRPKKARTRYKKLSDVAGHSLLLAQILSGRTHQIRRHFSGLGHPVLGDKRYGKSRSNRYFQERYGLLRPFLHAHRLVFFHPFLEKRIRLVSRLPGELASLLSLSGLYELADSLQGKHQ